MKNNDYPYEGGIITHMDISVLSTTNDIEQLRTLALAMVQKTMSEKAETEKLWQRILLQEEMLKLARQQRFGKKQKRSLFEEDLDADIAAVESQLDTLHPAEKSRPGTSGAKTATSPSSACHKNNRTGLNLPGRTASHQR